MSLSIQIIIKNNLSSRQPSKEMNPSFFLGIDCVSHEKEIKK